MSWATALMLMGALFVAVLWIACRLVAWHDANFRRIPRAKLDNVCGQYWSRDVK